jgi:hypothetical protein
VSWHGGVVEVPEGETRLTREDMTRTVPMLPAVSPVDDERGGSRAVRR